MPCLQEDFGILLPLQCLLGLVLPGVFWDVPLRTGLEAQELWAAQVEAGKL